MGADHFDRRLCVANAITDSYCDFHTHGDSYSNSDIYTDANCDADINTHRDTYGKDQSKHKERPPEAIAPASAAEHWVKGWIISQG